VGSDACGCQDALEYQQLTLTLSDLWHDRLLHKAVGVEPYQTEQLSKHVPEIDATLDGALKSGHSLDEPYVISRHITTHAYDHTRFSNAFSAAQLRSGYRLTRSAISGPDLPRQLERETGTWLS
jgi:hypothetical protein